MLAERLKQLRISKKKNQEDVANVLGITRQAYGHYEKGKREPDNNSLKIMSEYFEVSIDYLLTGKEQHKKCINNSLEFKKQEFFNEIKDAPEDKLAELIRFWEFIKKSN